MYIMENITISEVQQNPLPQPPPTPTEQQLQQDTGSASYGIPLTQVEIKNENIALNVMVSFLNLAQKRGAFSIDESAKIWECIKIFVQR